MNHIYRLGPFILTLMMCCGCATIISGTSQILTFQSNPSGAEVVVNGTSVGITPLTVNVTRKKGTTVLVRKDGYRDQSFVLKTKLEPWFWGNVIFGGVFGSTTDAATGATVEYSSDQYYTTLELTSDTPAISTMGVTPRSQNQAIRFILVNHNSLVSEMNSGSGEYLDALFDLLEVPEKERNAGLLTIKTLFIQNPSIPEFAEAVVETFKQ